MPHKHRSSVPALYATPWLKNVKKKTKKQNFTTPSRSCAILQDVDTISCLSLCLNPPCSTLSLLSVTRQLHSSHPSLSLYPNYNTMAGAPLSHNALSSLDPSDCGCPGGQGPSADYHEAADWIVFLIPGGWSLQEHPYLGVWLLSSG